MQIQSPSRKKKPGAARLVWGLWCQTIHLSRAKWTHSGKRETKSRWIKDRLKRIESNWQLNHSKYQIELNKNKNNLMGSYQPCNGHHNFRTTGSYSSVITKMGVANCSPMFIPRHKTLPKRSKKSLYQHQLSSAQPSPCEKNRIAGILVFRKAN